MITTAATSCW